MLNTGRLVDLELGFVTVPSCKGHELGGHVSVPVGPARGNGCICVAGSISKTLKVWQVVELRKASGDGFFGGLIGRMLLGEVAVLGEWSEVCVEIDVV